MTDLEEVPEEREYTVTWTIDVSAYSPEEAARKALDIQRDLQSLGTVFEVRRFDQPHGPIHFIDVAL